jgi:hypothetical protein
MRDLPVLRGVGGTKGDGSFYDGWLDVLDSLGSTFGAEFIPVHRLRDSPETVNGWVLVVKSALTTR